MNKPTAIHLCETLYPGGVARVMAHLASLHAKFTPVLAGWETDSDFANVLQATGAAVALVDDTGAFTRLSAHDRTTTGDDMSNSVIIIHRAGNPSERWNRLIEKCRNRGARAVVEFNHFGHADPGPEGARFDHAFFVSMSALGRHWLGMGCPSIDEYLKTHEVLYNPVLSPPRSGQMTLWRNDVRKTLGLEEKDVLFVSLLRPDPGRIDAMIPEVMQAFQQDQRIHLAVRQLPKRLANRAKQLLGSRFHDLPFSSAEEDIWQTLAAADAMVHFSSMGESFGMAIAEAMRCGLPVITAPASDPRHSNGQTELVLDGETGLLVRTPSQVVSAMQMLTDSNIRSAFGLRGQQRFVSENALRPEWIIARLETELAVVGDLDIGIDSHAAVRGPMPTQEMLRQYLQGDWALSRQGLYRADRCRAPWFDWMINARRFLWRVRRKWGMV